MRLKGEMVIELTDTNTGAVENVQETNMITADDRVIKTQGSARFEAMAIPLFQYKNFVFMWGGSYGKEHRCAYLLTPYLASINNLSAAVVKNTDKTMKITYTLTEETM